MSESTQIRDLAERDYQYGFVTDIETERLPKGLSEDVVRSISAKKEEPAWLLEWRLKAYRRFVQMLEAGHHPRWAQIDYPEIDYQDMYYYAAPKRAPKYESLEQVDLDAFPEFGLPCSVDVCMKWWAECITAELPH